MDAKVWSPFRLFLAAPFVTRAYLRYVSQCLLPIVVALRRTPAPPLKRDVLKGWPVKTYFMYTLSQRKRFILNPTFANRTFIVRYIIG
jgi:hypothetical protein